MTTRARNFVTSIVEPTVNEFFGDRNIRRGFLAAIVLFHMADYWNLEIHQNPTLGTLKKLHKELINDCPDFQLMRDVANASKHDRLTINPDPPRILSSSEQIMRLPSLWEVPLGLGVFNGASLVMVRLDDGTTSNLEEVVRSVLSMWEARLQ